MSKFIKLTMPEASTKAIINIDHITMVFEQSDGMTVVVHRGGEICVVESVEMVWGMISGEISEVVAMNEWIRVDKDLPEDKTELLVCDGYNYYLVWYENKIYGMADGQSITGITHWMPLPEPPSN